jgi:hypothetical protein
MGYILENVGLKSYRPSFWECPYLDVLSTKSKARFSYFIPKTLQIFTKDEFIN